MLPGAYKVFTTIVRRESVTLSALAEALMADKGQISRTVRELEELGLISRTPDPADGRSSLLSPTPEGLERLAAARAPQETRAARHARSVVGRRDPRPHAPAARAHGRRDALITGANAHRPVTPISGRA